MNNELKNSIEYINGKTNNQNPFSVPENYFDGVEDDFSIKLIENKLPKNNSFDIPTDYFESIEGDVFEKISIDSNNVKKNKVISLKERIFKFIPTAIAASLLVFITIQFFKIGNKESFTLEDLSATEIENWFDDTMAYSESNEFTVAYEMDVNESVLHPINIQGDAIENYFNTIEDHGLLLNEIQ